MIAILLYIFAACLLYNYVHDGGSFVLFSRVVEAANSVREQTPRGVRVRNKAICTEFKFGERIYSITIPQSVNIPWKSAAVRVDGVWKKANKLISYHAGPYKNFYNIPVKPEHLNPKFEAMGFEFQGIDPVVIERGQVITVALYNAISGNH